jgi:NAD(P)-dependent dehydrogenase (short-subunit alcohol dehydrogenase family)
MSWSTANIPDLTGRRALVTGATSGLGYETALELLKHGAEVIIAARNPEKSAKAAAGLAAASGRPEPATLDLDLSDLTSVAKAAAELTEPLDLLVNNAGVMALPHRRTADGFEMQFGTNHLGHFALTGLLLPALLERPSARVVTMSSGAHQLGRFNFDDLQRERRYQRWMAYGQSKLANLLFAFELARRAALADLDLTSVAAHPGYAATNLQLAGAQMEGSGLKARFAELGNRLFAQSDTQGALPALYAATMPDVTGGEYFGPDGRTGMRGYPTRAGTNKAARDPELARRLWTASEELTGVTYGRLSPTAAA